MQDPSWRLLWLQTQSSLAKMQHLACHSPGIWCRLSLLQQTFPPFLQPRHHQYTSFCTTQSAKVVSNNDQAPQSDSDKAVPAQKCISSRDLSKLSNQTCSDTGVSVVATDPEALAAASRLQHARDCFDSADCLAEPVPLADIDIDQQRQMLRDIQVRQALSRQQVSNQSGAKRTHSGQGLKQSGKQSKLVHDTGQQSITSLFTKR